MERRFARFWLALLCCCPLHVGCSALRDGHVKETRAEGQDSDETSKVGEVRSEAPKGFFKSTRLSGALSSEGRDIERSLGVH